MIGYFFDKYKMSCAFVWIAIIASLHLPGNDGRSQPFLGNEQELIERLSPPMPTEPVPCGISVLSRKYWDSCKETYLEDIFYGEFDDDVLTAAQLLQRISTACSNYDSFRKCAKCTAKRECREQRDMMYEALIGKWSVFCEQDQVSDWLQMILQSGYSYNRSCEDEYMVQTYTCYDQFQFNYTAYQLMSLWEGIIYYRSYISALLTCTFGEVVRLSGVLRRECGSTWQDALLTLCLRRSSVPIIGYNIDQDEIEMLQAIRC